MFMYAGGIEIITGIIVALFGAFWIAKVVYALYRDLRYGPPEPPVIARRIKIKSKKNRQGQRRSYHTVTEDIDDRSD